MYNGDGSAFSEQRNIEDREMQEEREQDEQLDQVKGE